MDNPAARTVQLIVPLDGSKASDRIVPIVRDLAVRMSASVRVLHVFGDVRELSQAAGGNVDWSELAEPRAIISPPASIRDSCTIFQGAGIDLAVVGRVGSAAPEIVREAEMQADSWVVISSQGEGGLRRLFLGSTAIAVIRASHQPVILISSGLDEQSLDVVNQNELISVFLDGTDESETAIEPAAKLAAQLDSKLDIVRVAETMRDASDRPSPDDEQWESPEVERIRQYLEQQTSSCASTYNITVRAVSLAGSPKVQLPRYAESARPGLIALATRKRSGIERWTYGSLAEHLADGLQTSLLLIPVE